jgi:peptidoglycan/LPS O-acetylase OafA/YrhL
MQTLEKPTEIPANPAQSPEARAQRKPPLPAITGLRTLLALNIVLFHFTPPHLTYLYPVIDHSYVFVGFFFLISGFILSYNYADRALTLDKRGFYLARLARIYPTYLLALLFSYPLLIEEWKARPHWEFWQGLVLTPFTLQGWNPSLATFWNTVGWTISAEVALYFAFPFFLRWFETAGRALNSPAKLTGAILALWVVGITPHICYFVLNPDHLTGPTDRFTSGYWIRALKYTPPPYLCTFLAGMVLSRLHAILQLKPRQRLYVAAAAFGALAIFFAKIVDRVPYIIVHGSLMMPLFALLILGLSGPNAFASVLSWTPLVLLGETTFALYLLHFNGWVMIHGFHLPERLHVEALDPWISYVALIALAFATMHLIERPANRYLRARLARRTPNLSS